MEPEQLEQKRSARETTPTEEIESDGPSGPKKPSKSFLTGVRDVGVALVTILASLLTLNWLVVSLVDRRIDDPEFLDKVASRVRPSALFDTNGSVLSDLGAMQFVDDILIERGKEGLASTITIRPNTHLAQAPLLSPGDSSRFDYVPKRGQKQDWVYELRWHTYLVLEGSPPQVAPPTFRLEIIR